MSTAEKCSDIAKDLAVIFQNIKNQTLKSANKDKVNNIIRENDRKKILKLFNYEKWDGYMKWIDQKLSQSGEDLQSFLEASGVESVGAAQTQQLPQQIEPQTNKKQPNYVDSSFQTESEQSQLRLLQRQNKKLKNLNANLHKKYEQLKRTYTKVMK